MSAASRPSVLFRVAAGPRIGFGHLVRALSLASALKVEPRLSVRGTGRTRQAARRLGARVVPGSQPGAVLAATAASLLVVDDRVAGRTAAWRRAARAAGIPIASVHDLGLGLGDADLVIDASLRQHGTITCPARRGPAYAILRPALRRLARRRRAAVPTRVLVALGGGPRADLSTALARRVAARHPGLDVQVAGGFLDTGGRVLGPGIRVIDPRAFDRALAGADLVVTAGGVTLLEACSLGVPSVAVAVVASQRPTIEDVAARHATLDGGQVATAAGAADLDRVGDAIARLLADGTLRARLARNGRRLVDGRGAARVAAELRRLMARRAGGVR